MRDRNDFISDPDNTLLGCLLFLIPLAAYITHIIWAISTLSSDVAASLGQIVLAAIGLFPPIGIIHGFYLWFGFMF